MGSTKQIRSHLIQGLLTLCVVAALAALMAVAGLMASKAEAASGSTYTYNSVYGVTANGYAFMNDDKVYENVYDTMGKFIPAVKGKPTEDNYIWYYFGYRDGSYPAKGKTLDSNSVGDNVTMEAQPPTWKYELYTKTDSKNKPVGNVLKVRVMTSQKNVATINGAAGSTWKITYFDGGIGAKNIKNGKVLSYVLLNYSTDKYLKAKGNFNTFGCYYRPNLDENQVKYLGFYVVSGKKVSIYDNSWKLVTSKTLGYTPTYVRNMPFGIEVLNKSYKSKFYGPKFAKLPVEIKDWRWTNKGGIYQILTAKGWSTVDKNLKQITIFKKYQVGGKADNNIFAKYNKPYNEAFDIWYARDAKGKYGAVTSKGKVVIPFEYDGYYDNGEEGSTTMLLMKRSYGLKKWEFHSLNNVPYTLGKAALYGIKSSYTYTGKAIKPLPSVMIGKTKLVNGRDYMVSYQNNKNVAYHSPTIIVKGKGKYTGTLKKSFNIEPISAKKATVTGIKDKKYTGNYIEQKPVVKFKGKTLKLDRDYYISTYNNIEVGKATMYINFYGNYSGYIIKTFKIYK